MQLPESLTKPTRLSKTLAMLFFVTLPFLGFWIGVKFQRSITVCNDISFSDQEKLSHGVEETSSIRKKTEYLEILEPSIKEGWQTYESKENNYTFEIPNTWFSSSMNLASTSFVDETGKDVLNIYNLGKVNINTEPELFLTGQLGEMASEMVLPKEVQISGERAFMEDDSSQMKQARVISGDTGYLFISQSTPEIFNQILYTFRFIAPGNPSYRKADTSEWKIYTSNQQRISFFVPKEYIVEETNNYGNFNKGFWGIYIKDPGQLFPGTDKPTDVISITLDEYFSRDLSAIYRDKVVIGKNTFTPFSEGLLENQYEFGKYIIMSNTGVDENDAVLHQFLSSINVF